MHITTKGSSLRIFSQVHFLHHNLFQPADSPALSQFPPSELKAAQVSSRPTEESDVCLLKQCIPTLVPVLNLAWQFILTCQFNQFEFMVVGIFRLQNLALPFLSLC